MSIFNSIIDRFNLKSATIFFAFILTVAGILMIINDIKDKGIIDIKSAVLSGKLETGSVGLILIFLSVVVVCFIIGFSNKKCEIKIKKMV